MTADASFAAAPRTSAKAVLENDRNPGLDSAAIIPLANDVRWVPSRKAHLVEAVRRGRMTLAEACEAYALSLEEFMGWKKALEREGLRGLRAGAISRG